MNILVLSMSSLEETLIMDYGQLLCYMICWHVVDYIKGYFEKIFIGDDETCNIVGRVDIQLNMSNITVLKLEDVKHFLSFHKILISIGELVDLSIKTYVIMTRER